MSVHAYGSYEDYDDARREIDADRRRDAEMDAWDDAHPPDMECESCGHEWWGGWSRGTRVDPPEPRYPDCPNCERG